MTETFRVSTVSSIGATATPLLAGVSVQTIVVGCIVANIFTSVSTALVTVYVSNNSTGTRSFIVRGAQIPSGQALPILGTNNRLALETGDSLVFKSTSGNNSIDGTTTYMEIT